MNRTMITAAIAAVALTATAADARQSARQRGVASGQEARERATTRDLNTQQMSAQAATGSQMGQMSAAPSGSAAMPAGSTAMADQGSPTGAAPMTGMAPDAGTVATTGTMGTTSEMAPANDPVASPGAGQSTMPPQDAAGMSSMSSGTGSAMAADGMMMSNGKWMMGDRPATKAEIKAHKDMMKAQNKPM